MIIFVQNYIDIYIQDYPAYYDNENVYEQRDKWLADFVSHVPPAKQDDIRQLIKENTEII